MTMNFFVRMQSLDTLCLIGWFTESVGGFQECAHGGEELRRSGEDEADEFFRRATIG